MTEPSKIVPITSLRPRYVDAIVASGLVDGIEDVGALDPRPYRYSEGDLICRRGDAAESLWVIVTGSVSVKDGNRTLFVRQRHEVVGEQNLLGNGYKRWYDLVASESQVELLEIAKEKIGGNSQANILWRNIAKIISLKLKDASAKTETLSRQLEDDSHILHAYTNEYALSRRMQAGSAYLTDYRVERAIVWFSDVVDFSDHISRLPPARTADIVQNFFNAQSAPIAAHGGHIDKFIGDGLMAFWVLSGDETAGDKAVEALKAAEEAVTAVSNIRIGNHPLHLRLGLHIGLVLSGDFGSTTRHQFTLIGPEVNKAARLEQVHEQDVIQGATNLGSIRLSAEFRDELPEPAKSQFRRLSKAKAKNIGDVELYTVA
ncbi:MAG: cyclic nucleotide-binding domain-containing protein [Hyphomicrobiales bacterium]|nr:cyclic nucleotide-binding domain-containing protein [Hyphomicrobiales bacterium]